MPRRPITPADDPPLNAGRWTVFASATAGLIAAIAVGMGWTGMLALGVESLVGIVFGGVGVGALVCLRVDAVIDRLRASRKISRLRKARRRPEWRDAARSESRQHT